MDLILCAWNISTEGKTILGKIQDVFKSKDLEAEIRDTATHKIEHNIPIIVFDEQSRNVLPDSDLLFNAGPLFELIKGDSNFRITTWETIKTVIELINAKKNDTQYIEKQNAKVGPNKNADIILSEEETKALKRIKDFLGGGVIVIKKGDLEIRIEE